MRLPFPLIVGTTAAFLVSGPAWAEKKPRAVPPAPTPSAATPGDGPAPPKSAAPAAPTRDAPTTVPPSANDAPTKPPPEANEATGTPSSDAPVPATGVSPQEPAAPVVPSASVQLRPVTPRQPKTALVGADEEDVKPARDTVGGHIAVGIDAGVVLPFGSVASGVPQTRTMGAGWSFGGDLAYGISRTVMLGAYVDVGLPDGQGPASSNSFTTIAAGPLLRYHLVQGARFDPWVAGGLGFRRTSGVGTSLTGVDWARLSLGGDWYPAPNVGFGPMLELSLGTFFAESPGTLPTKALNAHFVAGLRVVFDGPGK